MLAIRLQRTGRKGHAQFRMIVQEARRTPTSGRFVYLLGSYNPHTKALAIDTEKAEFYLKNGARPSDRVARLLKANGVKLPTWVKLEADKERTIRNAEKLRKNRPAEAAEAPVAEEAPADAEAPVEDAPTEDTAQEAKPASEAKPAEETPTEVAAEPEAPAEEAAESAAEEAPKKA